MLTCADNTLWNTTHFMKRYVCMFAFIIRVVTKYCITHPISYHFIHILIRHVKTVTSAVHKKNDTHEAMKSASYFIHV